VPRVVGRLRTWLVLANFGPHAEALEAEMGALRAAARAVLDSEGFRRFAALVVRYGNELNAGTARGGAMAVEVSALAQLGSFKSADGSVSLLRFLADEHGALFDAMIEELVPLAHRLVAASGDRKELGSSVEGSRLELLTVVREIAQHDVRRMELMPTRWGGVPTGRRTDEPAERAEDEPQMSPTDRGKPPDAFFEVMPPMYKAALARLSALQAAYAECVQLAQLLGAWGAGWGLALRPADFGVREAVEVLSTLAAVRKQAADALREGRDARARCERLARSTAADAVRRERRGTDAPSARCSLVSAASSREMSPAKRRHTLHGLPTPCEPALPLSIHGISTESLRAKFDLARTASVGTPVTPSPCSVSRISSGQLSPCNLLADAEGAERHRAAGELSKTVTLATRDAVASDVAPVSAPMPAPSSIDSVSSNQVDE
jgi:hypothetical protein